jgi:hypothetical protein
MVLEVESSAMMLDLLGQKELQRRVERDTIQHLNNTGIHIV